MDIKDEVVPVKIKNTNSTPKEKKPKIKQSAQTQESKPSPTTKKKKVETSEVKTKTSIKNKASNDVILKRITKIEKTLEKVSKQLDKLMKIQETNTKVKKSKEIKNTVELEDANKNIASKPKKKKSSNAKKEDVNLSFGFKVFYKKIDDEKSMKEKSDKIAEHINTYLVSQTFIKKHGLAYEVSSITKKGNKSTAPVKIKTILSIENRECIFKFSVNPIKDTGTKISEKTISRIIESIQDKLLYAEKSGWCEGLVYDIGGD